MGMTELTKDQMTSAGPPGQGQMMVNFMRLMAFVMFPVMINFESAMLCYWTANNLLTMTQTKLLMTKSVRDVFGIWDRPKPVPGQEAPSLSKQMETIFKKMKGEPASDQERMKQHNRELETKKRAIEMMRQAKERREQESAT